MAKNVTGRADHAAPASPTLARKARKAITAACGLAATLVAAGALDGTAATVVTGLLGIATALGVYRVPNDPGDA